MVADRDDKKADTLDDALTRFVNAYVRGEHPNIDEFVEQHPQHETQIRKRVGNLCEIDALFDSLVQADESDFATAATEPDLVGRTIGNFDIVEMIGRGGMGVVYLARDKKLKRSVAVKSMPSKLAADSTARMRFRREAELLASLNHPNIAVIHEVVEEESGYLILEYVPGQTLSECIARKPLTLEQTLSIGRQIAEAIAAAHKKGIVHRDLKPGNIKITPEGRVKVLDFGLAKPSVANAGNAETTATQRHHIMGTPAYMSPEQARGQSADHRTDIWSFGCIMYQMLTGKLPFEGKTATDMLARIIEREPDWELLPKETPENIRTLLCRCFEKAPNKRLDNIEDATLQISDTLSKPLTAPVRTVSPRIKRAAMTVCAIVVVALSAVGIWFAFYKQPPSREIRLVVLPFDNLGSDQVQWFVDGMSSEITDRLSDVYGLTVISRDSAIQCKKRQMGTRQIATDLDVDYILEGTVACEKPTDPNSAVRINLQLVQTSSDTQIWRQPFKRDRSQLHELQLQVAKQVAEQLDLLLLEQDRTWSDYIPTNSIEAHNLVLQGKAAKAAGTYHDAIPLYEKAIEFDPNYVRALGELAWAHTAIYRFEDHSPERLTKAWIRASRAYDLLPDHPFVQLVMARYYFQGHLDYERALEHLEKARDLHPNHPWMLYWTHAVKRRQGDFDQALVNIRRAFELNPFSANIACYLANIYEALEEYTLAEHYCNVAIMIDPNRPDSYAQKAWLYLIWQGDLEKARNVMENGLKKIDPTKYPEGFNWMMVTIDMWDKQYQDALDRLSQWPEVSETSIRNAYIALKQAEIHGYLQNTDRATEHYEFARDFLDNKLSERPGFAEYHSLLGLAFAGVGDKKKAIENGVLGTKNLPVTTDAVDGANRVKDLARIYVLVGKYELAIDQLEDLLSKPSKLSRALLRVDPVWKPLHGHPRFEGLMKSDK